MTNAYIVVGLGYGDEGKGTTVEWLTREHEAHTVVRFNGGAQAAHNVVRPNGIHHKFSQFGAGTFDGARTLMSRHTLVNPITALVEANILEGKGVTNAMGLLDVEDGALVTTPFHVAMNRLRELIRSMDGEGRHGSCGMGIGETVADSLERERFLTIRAGVLRFPGRLRQLLRRLQQYKIAQLEDLTPIWHGTTPQMDIELGILHDPMMVDTIMDYFAQFSAKARLVDHTHLEKLLQQPGTIVFEGAQGVLLDENYGFHPHTTWSTCTFANATDLIGDADVEVTKFGLVRSVQTKHGAGPFVTENAEMLSLVEGKDHNKLDDWQGAFRAGFFDLVATRYAVAASGGIDGLVVTWGDVSPGKICTAYNENGQVVYDLPLPRTLGEQSELTVRLCGMTPHTERLPSWAWAQELADRVGARLAVVSAGPTILDKIDCRD